LTKNKRNKDDGKRREKTTTHAFDADYLYKDIRDGCQVGYGQGQAGSLVEHGDGHLERAKLCIRSCW